MNDDWIKFAIDNGYCIICIMKDLEDRDYYPVYFRSEAELQIHKDNIISESKAKIIEIIRKDIYDSSNKL